VTLIETKHKAKDKLWLIILVAFITVLIVPVVLGAIGGVLTDLGNLLRDLMNTIPGYNSHNYLTLLVPIIGFLMILFLLKLLIDLRWETAMWVALLTLFVLFIIFILIPELAFFFPLA
jgi:hypothetical protein